MSLAPGNKLGPYEIISPLGAGGMGEVYRARDTRLERTVAIKILPAQFSADPVRKQRFEREAKTISNLNHPHICTLHDIGSQNGTDYLVMECVEGETLANRLEKGPLSREQVLRYGAQIADALDRAHRGGVVHRDLKPGNIMLTSSGAKLLDFGLAKPVAPLVSGMTLTGAATQTAPVTQEGTIVGTFQYMSPEQLEGKDVDARSDIFSFGAVLYEMLTGHKAFQGKSQFSVASAILEKEPEPIGNIKPMTPPVLDHTVEKCLAKDPDERWQSASDLKSELNWIAKSGSEVDAPVSIVSRRKKRERVAWISAAVAVAAVVFLLAGYVRPARLSQPLIISSLVTPPGARLSGLPKLSPDGRTLLQVLVNPDGRDSLWLRPLDSPSPSPLLGTEGASRPFWSHDGKSIGFFAEGKLKTVPATGGPVLTLCDAPLATGGSWSDQGTILFTPQFGGSVYKISASGGSRNVVLALDKSKFASFASPDFLPDGTHFTYTATSVDPATTGTYFASLDGRENKLIIPSIGNRAFSSGYLFYPRQSASTTDLMAVALDPTTGRVQGEPMLVARGIRYLVGLEESPFSVSDIALIYESSPTGAASGPALEWLDRSGKTISVVTKTDSSSDIRLSRDAQKVAYAKGDPNSDIWIQELRRDVPMRLTFDTSVDKGAPVWSPDGSELLFDIALDGKTPPGIYRKLSSGTGDEELVVQPRQPGAMVWPTDWSRDGKFILCVQGEIITRTRGEIWVVPLSDRKPRVLVRAPGAAYDSQFSPDGRWVAYVSKESGREEVYIVGFDESQVSKRAPFEQIATTSRSQVSANGGSSPRWRGDGKELFYVEAGSQFVAVAVATKGNTLSLGEARPLFRKSIAVAASPYDVTPDGQRFLVTNSAEFGTLPLTLVVNWMELLKNK